MGLLQNSEFYPKCRLKPTLGINVIRSIISLSKTPQAPLHLLNQVAPYLESAVTDFRGLFALFFSVKKICIAKPLQVLA